MSDLHNDDLIDAYHEGYFAFRSGDSLPYDQGSLADAWKDGKRAAQRDSRRTVVMPARPEGYFHARPEAL